MPQSSSGDPPVGRSANAQIDAFEDPLEDSTVITVASEFAADVWRRLCAAGKKCDLESGGHMAEEADASLGAFPHSAGRSAPRR